MEILQSFYKDIISILPVSLVVIMSILVIVAARYFINRQFAHKPGRPFRRQVITLVLSFVALLLIILAMPIGDNTRGQLLGLIGILLSAAIAARPVSYRDSNRGPRPDYNAQPFPGYQSGQGNVVVRYHRLHRSFSQL